MIEKGKIWKFSGVILIVYVIIAGLLIPLKSGIESGKIGVTKEEIDLKIKDYKFLFQMNFHN